MDGSRESGKKNLMHNGNGSIGKNRMKQMLSGKDGTGMDGAMTLLIIAGTGSGRMMVMVGGKSAVDIQWVIKPLKSRNPR